ncbi:MAG: hypothetical protein ACYDDA_03720 [Acidiferrobacteraceae bacterium]
MNYMLTLTDAERDYLRAIILSNLIRDAGRMADLDERRDADKYAKGRAAVHVGGALLAALSPERLQVIGPTPRGGAQDGTAPVMFYREAADDPAMPRDPHCVHGIPSNDPCPKCDEPTEAINARMRGAAAP